MAAKKFPIEWPTVNIRSFKDINSAYTIIRDAFRAVEDLRKRITDVGNDHATKLIPLSGIVAPTSTPTDLQLFYLDTVAKDMYISVGTGSSADWKKITP